MAENDPFQYPSGECARKHGPRGYRRYESYWPWLRDEFAYRCGFCLVREAWIKRARAFEIDHLVAVSVEPFFITEYDNLVYSCASCNALKQTASVPDPASFGYGQCLEVDDDGVIRSLNGQGDSLIELLQLNHPDSIHSTGTNSGCGVDADYSHLFYPPPRHSRACHAHWRLQAD